MILMMIISSVSLTGKVYAFQTFDLQEIEYNTGDISYYDGRAVVELETLISRLSEAHDVNFLYDSSIMNGKYVNLQDLESENLLESLEFLLKSNGLAYQKESSGAYLILADAGSEAITVQNQRETITGQITDEVTGEPLFGVHVVVKGTTLGSSTDTEGRFTFSVNSLADTLMVSYIGYVPKEVPLLGRSQLNIQLTPDVLGLGEELIVIGYGTQRRANLTGAVDHASGEAVQNRAVQNLTQGLQGVLPNVNIRLLDGKPIQSPRINIRGTTSIGQGGSALVLIDGIEGDPSMLNPNDVASITVLKDASAAAIYGSRGAFGVVLIETRDAAPTDFSVTYDGSFSVREPIINPADQYVSDGYLWATMFDKAYRGWFGTGPQSMNTTAIFPPGYLEEWQRRRDDPSLPNYELDANGRYIYYDNTNWYDLLYKDRQLSQEHNLSFSRRTDVSSFIVSGRYSGQDGIYNYSSDRYNIYNLSARGYMQLFPWLHLRTNSRYAQRDYWNPINVAAGDFAPLAINLEGHPVVPMFNPDGTLTASGATTVGDMWYGKSGIEFDRRVFSNKIELQADITNNIRIVSDFTLQNTDEEQFRRQVPVPYSSSPGEISYISGHLNNIRVTNREWNYYAFNAYSEFEDTFRDRHYFKAMVGTNYEQSTLNRLMAQRDGLLFEDARDLNMATGETILTTGGFERWEVLGAFNRFNYIYDNRYLFEFSARLDGSSKFPENERYAFFPSGSVGWRISQEPFWTIPSNIISDLRLRASYGSLGNGNISSYHFHETFSISRISRILDGSRPQMTIHPAPLPDGLTWETATTANLGLDLEFMHGRLQFTADAYVRETTDMFTPGRTLPATFGHSPPYGNYADLRTTGWEAQLTWRDRFDVAGDALGYRVRLSLADHVSEITRYNNPNRSLNDYYEGMIVGEIWGYVTEGFFESPEDVANHADQTQYFLPNGEGQFQPGDIKFRDLNGDGFITPGENTVDNPGDRKIIGNSTPRYTFGINLDVNWRGFFVSTFFQGVGKQDWYPSPESLFWGQYNRPYNDIPLWHLQDGMIWSEENPDSFFPIYRGYYARRDGRPLAAPQTKYLMNVAYIRLKNLQFGYNISHARMSVIGLNSARVYASAENLWIWSPMFRTTGSDINIDLENITAPADRITRPTDTTREGHNYPLLRTITLGMSLNF